MPLEAANSLLAIIDELQAKGINREQADITVKSLPVEPHICKFAKGIEIIDHETISYANGEVSWQNQTLLAVYRTIRVWARWRSKQWYRSTLDKWVYIGNQIHALIQQ